MKVQAAAMSMRGINFVVVVAQIDVVTNRGEADMAMDALRSTFGDVPVILMAQRDDGSPVYYGDADIVELLRDVPVERMPWKEYPAR